jgi:hypothetical protein
MKTTFSKYMADPKFRRRVDDISWILESYAELDDPVRLSWVATELGVSLDIAAPTAQHRDSSVPPSLRGSFRRSECGASMVVLVHVASRLFGTRVAPDPESFGACPSPEAGPRAGLAWAAASRCRRPKDILGRDVLTALGRPTL